MYRSTNRDQKTNSSLNGEVFGNNARNYSKKDRGDEVSTETTIAEKFTGKKISEKMKNAPANNREKNAQNRGLLIIAVNRSIESAAEEVEVGGEFVDFIYKALNELRNSEWYKNPNPNLLISSERVLIGRFENLYTDNKIEINFESPYCDVVSVMDSYKIQHIEKEIIDILFQIDKKQQDEIAYFLKKSPRCSFEYIKGTSVYSDLHLLRQNLVNLTLWLFERTELPYSIKFEFEIYEKCHDKLNNSGLRN